MANTLLRFLGFLFCCFFVMAEVKAFVDAPSEEGLNTFNRDQLLKIAEHYNIDVGDQRLKANIKAIVKACLYDMDILIAPQSTTANQVEDSASVGLTFEQQKELLTLQVELKEKDLEMEELRHKTEMAKLDIEHQRLALIKSGEIREGTKGQESAVGQTRPTDIVNSLRLVPKFDEQEVEVFFTLFERVADARGWDNSDCTVLLQCVLTGRAQEAFASMSAEDSTDYEKVKAAVLKAYELVPEAYRQRFRTWTRGNKSYLEFARDLRTHFHRWCAASGVNDFQDLCNLLVLEQFKNSVPEPVAVYISEKKVKTVSEAASLADDFTLTHRVGIWKLLLFGYGR